ncbi:serine/threonine-protein kinase Chk2-like isoform X2 [Centruroides sculpturatus]|uniref:serine/threonine-protein kinase Chk2-like isoform X2 n=1 Tax=Centruroides sculpturatus TaxID=218467 RepID=UPI000C6E4AC5|nr:serine/threonine-protein kinase Chk2-like isoform X2 [Centruroides sculpturatus]
MSQNENLASSGGSGGAMMGTQEKSGCSYSDDETPDGVWGKLFPCNSKFMSLVLTKDKYTFGRDSECDYCFNSPQLKSHSSFTSLSKFHFSLIREKTSTGIFTLLEDHSSNGTYINGVKVGKTNKQLLTNNDEISLIVKKNRAFVYMDEKAEENSQYPVQITNKYTVSTMLGRGTCGEVRLIFEKGTCYRYALKIISKKTFSSSNNEAILKRNIMNEVNVLRSLDHPCIVKVEDVIDTEDTLYIVLELVEGGELFDRVVSVDHFDEPTAKLLFYQMVVAVKYLHDQEITHRDLKPENILLSGEENETVIKVTDFGLSKFVNEQTMLKTFCGTPTYLAPEIIVSAGSGSYTKAIDCWSLGVILYICLVGYPPFSDDYKDMPLTDQIIQGRYRFPLKYWHHVSKPVI